MIRKILFFPIFIIIFSAHYSEIAYPSEVFPYYYNVCIDGHSLTHIKKGGIPYIRVDNPDEKPNPNKILVSIVDIVSVCNVEKFNEKDQTVQFQYWNYGNINNQMVTLLYKFAWNFKTCKVSFRISWAPWPSEKVWKVLKHSEYYIPYGYYGYGFNKTGEKQIWIPVVPFAELIWGKKRYIKEYNLQIPTYLFFPKRNTLMIFTGRLTSPVGKNIYI